MYYICIFYTIHMIMRRILRLVVHYCTPSSTKREIESNPLTRKQKKNKKQNNFLESLITVVIVIRFEMLNGFGLLY